MNIVPLLVSLATGAVGGNAAGSVLKKLSLGTLGNSLAGILGGGLGGSLLQMLGMGVSPGGSMDMGSILGSLASGGAGGGAVMAVIGMARKAMAKA